MSSTAQAIGNVQEVSIIQEMEGAYLDYAMSVIVSRALPDVRDGLKPVHRRILYAMHDMGLVASRPYRKSARIVGEVLGKYHPHSDVAVYDAMVRMAQDFSLRYPLIDGQGNFGSVDGDNAAAMRYTEARLAPIAALVLTDLEKDTVDWQDNFDGTLQEPAVLPATLPNLLINGASGIAVGMSTNVPPHNLGEIVDALVFLLDHYQTTDDITVEELMHYVKGPDFPTGGILYRYREGSKGEENIDAIAQGYATGRTRLILQAKAHFEEMSRGRNRIVITELPYQTNKTNLLERVATLVRDGKIEGITDLRDESDRAGMRIVIELTRNAEPKVVLADLFKYTPMQQTFGMSMLALVNGEPKTLGLKRMLQHFIEHRREVIRRRSEYDLARARARAHIVEGLLKALDILDEVIDTIRRSQRVETARNNLMKTFGFSEAQAQAILDMPLKRLAALEWRRLQEEYNELLETIRYLEDLLITPERVLSVIRADLLALREQYGDSRRTQIVDRTKGTLTSTDLLPDQVVWVAVGADGELRRQAFVDTSQGSLRQMRQGSEVALLTGNTRDFLYLFSKDGRCNRVPIHELPQDGRKHLAEFTQFTRRDTVTAALTLARLAPDEVSGYLFLVTRQGFVKRIALADFIVASASDPEVIRVDDGDRLGWVLRTQGDQEVILATANGQSIRFAETAVRSMGLAAGGVGGIKLSKGDMVVSAVAATAGGEVLTVTERGYWKRTPLSEYSTQGRYGGGIITHKVGKRTGKLAGAIVIQPPQDRLALYITARGTSEFVRIEDVPRSGRGTQGQTVVTLTKDNGIVGLKAIGDTLTAAGGGTVPSQRPADVAQSPPPASANGQGTSRRRARQGGTKAGARRKSSPRPAPTGQENGERPGSSQILDRPSRAKKKAAPAAGEMVQGELVADSTQDAPPAKPRKTRRASKVEKVASVTGSQVRKKDRTRKK